ncbi:MAG TPA: YdbH domain-containing protein, partial [Opitutaceae bacterium]|nr:YdbH domain-containing protein [Opitutaceae bacterium]
AQWFALLAPKYFPTFADLAVAGSLALTGEGTLHEGKVAGGAQLDLRNGSVQDAAKTWSVKGIGLHGALRQLPTLVTEAPVKLTFTEATIAGVTARDGALELGLGANGTVQVARATAAMLDGHVEVTPFAFPLAKPVVQTDVHFTAIEIERLAALLPPVLADATGKVSGRMAIGWSAEDGLSPGSGRLQIDPGAAAVLRLSPQPGFFTKRVPERLTLLPKSLGALSRMFSPINPAYETLRAIEMGEMKLEVNSLDVGVRPEGDPEGRTARVVLTARPAAPGTAVKSVRFEINVSGPLADLVRLGLQGKIDVHLN